jgi:cytochrome c556
MKKMIVAVMSVICLIAIAGQASAELRPISKIMVKRLVLMQTVISDLAISDFDKAAADARVLAETVNKDTEILPSQGLKDANTTLEKSLQTFIHAAGKKDALTIVSSYADIIGNCYGCHSRYRDPK